MKDDAAKVLIYILGSALLLGLLVLGGHYLIMKKMYTTELCLESNRAWGFYPYNPPRSLREERGQRGGSYGGDRRGGEHSRGAEKPAAKESTH